MSYDLTILRVRPGTDPVAVAEMEPGEEDTRPLEEWDAPLRARIVEELRRINPSFEVSDHEINDDKTGFQISFYGRQVNLSIPYWHSGDAAAHAFELVWASLDALCGPSGAVVHDGQIGRLLNLAADRDLVLRTYAYGTGALASATAPRRPWWKFW